MPTVSGSSLGAHTSTVAHNSREDSSERLTAVPLLGARVAAPAKILVVSVAGEVSQAGVAVAKAAGLAVVSVAVSAPATEIPKTRALPKETPKKRMPARADTQDTRDT